MDGMKKVHERKMQLARYNARIQLRGSDKSGKM